MENSNIILAEITNNIIKEISERINNLDNNMNLIKDNVLAKSNWNGQKVAYEDTIKIIQKQFMKNIK